MDEVVVSAKVRQSSRRQVMFHVTVTETPHTVWVLLRDNKPVVNRHQEIIGFRDCSSALVMGQKIMPEEDCHDVTQLTLIPGQRFAIPIEVELDN